MWNSLEFVERVTPLAGRYETENSWFKQQWWGDRNTYLLNAWRLYRCANQSGLPFLLLGDTKIRKDPALVMNFGLSSAGGVQDKEEIQLVERLERRRGNLGAPPVLGRGSILSDRNWTPLLNDAYMLGGIHAGKEFHFAEDAFAGYEEFLKRREVFGVAAPQYHREPGPRGLWKDFLVHHEGVLWKGHVPRVLARELLGLKRFGYAPVFTMAELGFFCQNSNCAAADFEQYLDALAAANFHGNDQQSILGALGEFLFGDAQALTRLHGTFAHA